MKGILVVLKIWVREMIAASLDSIPILYITISPFSWMFSSTLGINHDAIDAILIYSRKKAIELYI